LSFAFLALEFSQKLKYYVSQDYVDALFRLSGKYLRYFVANIVRTICTKFCQNQPNFIDDMTKHFGVFSIHNSNT